MRSRSRYKPRWSTPVPVDNPGVVTRQLAKRRYSDGLIAATKEVWQPYYDQRLTDEDAREIIENTVAFMRILSKIRDKQDEEPS